MAKTADQLSLVERVSGDFHPAHQGHVTEEPEQLLGTSLDRTGGLVAVVGCEGDGSLDGEGGRVIGSGGEGTAEGGGE